MTKKFTGPDLVHKLKIKPHADRVRAVLSALPCPGIAEVTFELGAWRPSNRFYSWVGEQEGKKYSVRRYAEKLFVFRLA